MLSNISQNNPTQPFDRLPDIERLEVILKVTERCNINCTYCYFFNNEDQGWRQNPAQISHGTIKDLVDYIRAALTHYAIKVLQIDLHGGEPLMMRKGAFQLLCEEMHALAQETGIELRLALQTNGTLFTPEWCDLIRRFDVSVAVSLDGRREENDVYRVDKKGRGTHQRVADGIALLKTYKIDPALLCVINPRSDARSAFLHFTQELGIRRLHYLFPDMTHEQYDAADTPLYTEYCLNLLDTWWPMRHQINIKLFTRYQALLTGGYKEISAYREVTAKNVAFTVASSGRVSIADDLRNIETDLFKKELMISNSSFADFVNSDWRLLHKSSTDKRANECKECCWSNICNSGDIAGGLMPRYSKSGGYANPSVYCIAFQQLLLEFSKRLVLEGTSTETILSSLTAHE